jgi:hypothetical protein
MYDNTATYEIIKHRSRLYVPTAPTEQTEQPTVNDCFENFIVSTERVFEILGKSPTGKVTFEESEQGDARRQLLHVEKVAIENKRLQRTSEASYIESISYQLHDIIVEEMSEYLKDTPGVISSLLNLPSNIGMLLDALTVRACSVSKLEPIVATMPWLVDDLTRIVNTPRFRRKDSRGRIIIVETLRTALSFLGIENLRLLIPSLIVKRATPQITDPYPLIKQKLSSYSTGVAITAQHIAIAQGINKSDAYMLGMLGNLGRCAVIRLYFRMFDKVQLHLLQECQKDKEHKRHDALVKIVPSANHLIALQHTFADALTADVLDELALKRLFITPAMRVVAGSSHAEPSVLSDTLSQARLYAQVRSLHQTKLTDAKTAKSTLSVLKYPQGMLAKLKNIDIFTLPLVKSDAED